MSTAIVFGANGISGLALISHLTSLPSSRWKKIIAFSRREPVLDHQDDRVVFKSIDLLGERDALEKALKDAGAEEADHVFFYAYVAKEDEQELIDVNTVLFKNALQVVANVATQLQSFQLQTGYKYYGTHKGGSDLAPYPWKESSQRHPGGNFYYVEEDLLAEACKQNNWREIVTRPNHIVGASKGNFMSLATTLGLYAIASKELGQKLVYPGSSVSWNLPYDMSIASHNAKFQVFATEKGLQGAYNIHAGEPITFRDLWTRTADYFGLPAHQPAFNTQHISDPPKEIITPHSIQEWSVKNKEKFPEIARKLDLDPKVFEYATWDFIDFAAGRTWKDEGSLEKAREAGWKEDVDVWEGFKGVFEKLKELKILPK